MPLEDRDWYKEQRATVTKRALGAARPARSQPRRAPGRRPARRAGLPAWVIKRLLTFVLLGVLGILIIIELVSEGLP